MILTFSGSIRSLEQLALDLQERGALVETDGAWDIRPDEVADVPSSVNAMLIARLDRLAAQVKSVVQTAAVLGREFEVAVLSRMLREAERSAIQAAERASFLGSLFVILMPFLGRLFRGQKLYRAAVAGSVIVIIGTWCLFGAPNGNWGGDLFGLLRAGACAGMLLAVQYFAGEDWLVSSFINLSVVAAFSIAVAGVTGQMQVSLQPTVLFPAALSAVLGSVVGGSVLIWSGRYLSSALAGVLMFLEAPFTLLWGIVLMGAVLTPTSLVAYTLIGTGTICVLAAGSLQLPRKIRS